jgi:hypothetical protein
MDLTFLPYAVPFLLILALAIVAAAITRGA